MKIKDINTVIMCAVLVDNGENKINVKTQSPDLQQYFILEHTKN